MTRKEIIEDTLQYIYNKDKDKLVRIYNQYCEEERIWEDQLHPIDEINEYIGYFEDKLYVLQNCYRGEFNPFECYFYIDIYCNICSTNDPLDKIDLDELADYIDTEENALEDEELQKILDEYKEGEENGSN